MNCYNCSKLLTKKSSTKEHIPAQAYYVGYPDQYKVNRIVVPACRNCNEKYSETDQELRDAIGITNENDQKQKELTHKSVKSILHHKSGKDRLLFDSNGKVIGVEFNSQDFELTARKDFRGIFYNKYGKPISKNWKLKAAIVEGNGEFLNQGFQGLFHHINENCQFSISGHEDIFKYKIMSLDPDENGIIQDTGDLTSSIAIAGILVYHNKYVFIIVAAKSVHLSRIKITYININLHDLPIDKKKRRNKIIKWLKKRKTKRLGQI